MNKKNGSSVCPKAGIKIHETLGNQTQGYNQNQSSSKNISFHKTTLLELDLNIDNYTLNDLYNLFNVSYLDEPSLKTAKQIVLKMHPDKSQLDSKYFLFFSKAYKRLFSIYEFQNKSTNKQYKDADFFEESNKKFFKPNPAKVWIGEQINYSNFYKSINYF